MLLLTRLVDKRLEITKYERKRIFFLVGKSVRKGLASH